MEHELTEEIRSFIRHQKLIIERIIHMSAQLDQLTAAIQAEQALKAQADAILPTPIST